MISLEHLRRIAVLGGRALKPEQRTFSLNKELAREAGRKGGKHPKKKVATLACDETPAQDPIAQGV